MAERGQVTHATCFDWEAWIMAVAASASSEEKPPFLASFVSYVERGPRGGVEAGEISGFLPLFVGYARQHMAVVLRASQRLSTIEVTALWQYPD